MERVPLLDCVFGRCRVFIDFFLLAPHYWARFDPWVNVAFLMNAGFFDYWARFNSVDVLFLTIFRRVFFFLLVLRYWARFDPWVIVVFLMNAVFVYWARFNSVDVLFLSNFCFSLLGSFQSL